MKILEKKLEEFTKICDAINNVEEKNSDIFRKYKSLIDTKNELEEEIKEIAREEGSIDNKKFSVKVSDTWKKWFDYKKFVTSVDVKTLNKIEAAGGIKAEVSYEVVSKLIKDKEIEIDPSIIQKTYLEKKQTTRVTIKSKE